MSKYARFYAILKEINASGAELSKEDAVLNFTDGRTSSLSSLSATELGQLEASLKALSPVAPKLPANATDNDTRDQMRKAIIAIFKSISQQDPASLNEAKNRAIRWAEKYGCKGVKRPFNDYTEPELYQLIRNAEKVKKHHITTVNKLQNG